MTKKRIVNITIFLFLSATFLIGFNFFIKKLKNSDYFIVKKVRVNGIYNSDKNKINKIAKRFIGKNIFEINLNRSFLIDDIWIEKIRISRKLPNKINMDIFEKKSSFVFRQGRNCYHYIHGGEKIKTKCNNPSIVLKGKIYTDYFDEFTKIYNQYNLKNNKINLYPSYFKIIKNEYAIKCSYNLDIFKKNFYYFENAIMNNYKKIDLVDLRIKGKIFINGVINEAG
jgi:hypothetical protein